VKEASNPIQTHYFQDLIALLYCLYKERMDELVDLMLDTVCSKGEIITIA